VIRPMRSSDLAAVAALAQQRRRQYESFQPQFWRVAEDAVAVHTPFLEQMTLEDDAVALVAEGGVDDICGFVIGRLVPPPPVYDPGGPSGFIDDFAVAQDDQWPTVGRDLMQHAAEALRQRGAVQLVVVCGHLDEAKRATLTAAGLSLAAEWYVSSLEKVQLRRRDQP
jgi:ribosomal protein S18 acetylase RimI-like enzyme